MPKGDVLNAFAEAAIAGGAQDLKVARDRVAADLGADAAVDAAAVVANFCMMDRIADGAGIVLDDMLQVVTQQTQQQLDLNDFAASANTPRRSRGFHLFARVVTPLAQRAFPLVSRLAARAARSR